MPPKTVPSRESDVSTSLRKLFFMVRDRPAPGFTKQRATSVITSLVGVAVTLGVLPVTDNDKVLSWGNIAISVLFVLWGAVHTIIALVAAQHTTPIADPQNANGKALVPAASSAAVQSIPGVADPVLIAENDPNPPTATDPSLLPDPLQEESSYVGGID